MRIAFGNLTTNLGFAGLVGVLYLAIESGVHSRLTTSLLTTCLILYLATLALNVVWGYSGQLSLAYAAIQAIASYATIITLERGWTIYAALAAGVVIATATALAVGLLLRRLEGLYYSIATFAVGLLVTQLIASLDFTGGGQGIVVYDAHVGIPSSFLTDLARFDLVVTAAAAVACATGVQWLMVNARGRRIISVRENPDHARSVGVRVERERLVAAALAGAIAGLAGGLYVMHIGAVDPVSLSTQQIGFSAILALLIGGRGTYWGPIIGSLVVGSAAVLSPLASYWTYIMIGVLAIVVALFFPQGVAGTLGQAVQSRVRLRKPADAPPATFESLLHDPRNVPSGKSVFRAEGLDMYYGTHQVVCDLGLSVSVSPTEVLGIAGPNGAGKSTAMAGMAGAQPVRRGLVSLDEVALAAGEAARVSRGVVRVAQDTNVMPSLTSRENVMLSCDRGRASLGGTFVRPLLTLRREADLFDDAARVLAAFGLSQYAEYRASELSYGNRRLLALACAVALRPKVLLLDEPTAGLSPAAIDGVRSSLQRVRDAGTSMVIIDHRLDFLDSMTPSILMMSEGRTLRVASLTEHVAEADIAKAYLGALAEDSKPTLARTTGNESPGRGDRSHLVLRDLSVGYGGKEVLAEVSLTLPDGVLTGWLGPNGAGKTTIGSAVAGLVTPTRGDVYLGSDKVTDWSVTRRVKRGIVLVPSGRRVFGQMTVEQNLHLAAALGADGGRADKNSMALAWDLFPRLEPLRGRLASHLSGGQKQMLVTARALVAHPELLILDEPFAGLSPKACDELQASLVRCTSEYGMSIVVIDQDVSRVSSFVDYLCLFAAGRLQVSGGAREVLARRDLFASFLGISSDGEDVAEIALGESVDVTEGGRAARENR